MASLSRDFVERIVAAHGAGAAQWLEQLPFLIETLEQRWAIKIASPFEPLSYHYVAPAVQRCSSEVVVKLGPPGEELTREAECLRLFGGNGAVRLLDADFSLGAMLMERILPGTGIQQLDDTEAVMAAAAVMRRLHRPAIIPPGFPTVSDWGEGFQRLRNLYHGRSGPLPEELVAEADVTFSELAASMGQAVLLHGDLHHDNVLASGRNEWLAVDPQGVIGEPAYEVGAFLRNPMPRLAMEPDLAKVMSRRIRVFSGALHLDADRLRQWGFAQAVLAAVWSLEQHATGWEMWLVAAKALRRSAQ